MMTMKLDVLKWHPYLSDDLKDPIKPWLKEAKVKAGQLKGNGTVKVCQYYSLYKE
jgi:hypothetical protein